MNTKELFDIANRLRALREEKTNRSTRVEQEQVLIGICDASISNLLGSLSEADTVALNDLID